MLTNQENIHQGKYGYYPCDKETFLKLKALYKEYVKAQHQGAAWHRWARKSPKNRIIKHYISDEVKGRILKSTEMQKEPKICPYFLEIKDNKPLSNNGLRGVGSRNNKTYWTGAMYRDSITNFLIFPKQAYRYRKSENGGDIEVLHYNLAESYLNAKRPVKNIEETQPLTISLKEIDELYQQVFND